MFVLRDLIGSFRDMSSRHIQYHVTQYDVLNHELTKAFSTRSSTLVTSVCPSPLTWNEFKIYVVYDRTLIVELSSWSFPIMELIMMGHYLYTEEKKIFIW